MTKEQLREEFGGNPDLTTIEQFYQCYKRGEGLWEEKGLFGMAMDLLVDLDSKLEQKDKEIAELKGKIKLLEDCREYDASGKNRPDGYIVTSFQTAQRIEEINKSQLP